MARRLRVCSWSRSSSAASGSLGSCCQLNPRLCWQRPGKGRVGAWRPPGACRPRWLVRPSAPSSTLMWLPLPTGQRPHLSLCPGGGRLDPAPCLATASFVGHWLSEGSVRSPEATAGPGQVAQSGTSFLTASGVGLKRGYNRFKYCHVFPQMWDLSHFLIGFRPETVSRSDLV